MRKYRVADLFSGAGGLSLGFIQAGFKVVFSADNDTDSVNTYSHNLGPHSHLLDIAATSPKSIADLIKNKSGQIDVLIGGPPCQGFSVQRRGSRNDPRNHLLLKHVEIGLELSAKAIVIENVPTIFGKRGVAPLGQALKLLGESSYSVTSAVLQAADYGVPQLRRRAFVVALRHDVDGEFQFERPTHSPSEYLTVRQALSGIPPVPEDYSPHPELANHQRRKISEINLERLSHVPEGGGRLDIPEELRLPCHRKDNGHRHLDVYGRMWWDRPAPTITSMFDNFTRGRFAHPSELRNITNREGARLQSFQDTFLFLGTQKSVAKQIGNAVPPALAASVARSLLSHFLGNARAKNRMGKKAVSDSEGAHRNVPGEQRSTPF